MGNTADPTTGSSKLTYEDYVSLPDDNRRYEILDGDLVVTASPTTVHQLVSGNLEFLLQTHVKAHALGSVLDAPVDVILDETTVVVPDLVFISAGRCSIIERRGIVGPPDLVVEILSDSTVHRDRGAKTKLYARFGVDWYWLVEPDERRLEIYERRGQAYRISGSHTGNETVACTVPPGLEIELAQVWPG